MKIVPLSELKRRLSALIREAAAGDPVLITRHGKPLAYLVSSERQRVHVGRRAGKGNLQSVLKNATGGEYLSHLQEDRNGEPSPIPSKPRE